MISLGDITSFDVIVALIFLLFVIRGTWIGFMRQLAFFLALIVSYILAGQYTGQMMPYVGKFIESPKAVFFISFVITFIFCAIFLFMFSKVLNLVIEIALAGWFDRALGFLLGLVKAFFVTSILYMIMSSGLSSANDLVKKSITAPILVLGSDFVQQLILDPEMRSRFLPKEPAIIPDSGPASEPTREREELPDQEIHYDGEDRG